MYFISTVILSLVGMFVQYGECTINCTLPELGIEVPSSACDLSHCKDVTIDQLNAIKNKEVLATKWNYARSVLVSKCKLTYNFHAAPSVHNEETIIVDLSITINYGEKCDQVTYYNLSFASAPDIRDGKFREFLTEDGDAVWDMCFPYLEESDFIYRRCIVYPKQKEDKEYATIYVYEEAGGPTGKPGIIQAANSLGDVDWANKTVNCL